MGKEIVFLIDNIEAGIVTIDLGPEESKEVSIEITPSETGIFTVKVEALTATFEVKEPYPDVPNPKIMSIAWLPESSWPSYIYPQLEGTILLPAPGEGQNYIIRAQFQESVNLYVIATYGDFALTYKGDGLWYFAGRTIMPYKSGGDPWWCDGMCTEHYIDCPVCGRAVKSHWGGDLHYLLQHHCNEQCYYGDQAHCNVNVSQAVPYTVQEPCQYPTRVPCLGTRLHLELIIYLMAGLQIVREWKLPAGSLVVTKVIN